MVGSTIDFDVFGAFGVVRQILPEGVVFDCSWDTPIAGVAHDED